MTGMLLLLSLLAQAGEPAAKTGVDISTLSLPAFSGWLARSAEKLEEQNGRRRLRLWYEAPPGVGGSAFLHCQPLEAWFDREGRPLEPLRFSPLKKVDLEKVESLPPVRRFAERYGPLRVFHPLQAGAPLRLTSQEPMQLQVELVLAPAPQRRDAVESYRVPEIQGFPGRRELLRFAQALSLRHPGCRPTLIEGRRLKNPPPVDGQNGSATPPANCTRYPLGNCLEADFVVEGRLQGAACPERFSVRVDQALAASVLP